MQKLNMQMWGWWMQKQISMRKNKEEKKTQKRGNKTQIN